MRADCYWINMTEKPAQFFLEGCIRYTVGGFDYLFLKPDEIGARVLPKNLVHCTHALVQLYRQGYPSRTNDEHRRLVHAFKMCGLLEQHSSPGNIIPTQEGAAILQAAGIA